ncbi:hypothetical protein BXT86_00110 [candidate division WOR-3 bacterium 4484_100]|uniref:Uncharacterized protein n=1 Tax=candidate division WOR-3 bacterium 4484_100 TaxID=1936077 RepID=A0A1V4QH23_UNCW3|nr:MAG: hypothetical protein BXT86_00110 [candidate division WOR-3 bacterium 4484_100]
MEFRVESLDSVTKALKRLKQQISELENLERAEKTARINLKAKVEKLRRALMDTIHTLARLVAMLDRYTAGHQTRVSQLASAIAQEMTLPEETVDLLRMAALIHDIGKIYIPAEILNKPARLTPEEFDRVKMHPQLGYNILMQIDFQRLLGQIILQHHERIDGSGYPQGLTRPEILLEARILAVADVVEAMCSDRAYRPAPGLSEALKEINKNRGILYDPDVVDVCIKIFKEKNFKF